jgi:hypothetical protein
MVLVTLIAEGWVMVSYKISSHKLSSIIVIEYGPAGSG